MEDAVTLDLEGALERVDGDRELLMELVEIFFDVYQEQVEQLIAAVDGGDSEQVFSVAHSIKGAAGNVGAMAASHCAREIELRGHQSSLQGAQGLVDQLQQQVAKFRAECTSHGLFTN